MNRIIRFFNQNRATIYLMAGVIIFGLLIIQVLNIAAEEENDRKLNDLENTIKETYKEDSTISGSSLSYENSSKSKNIIQEFVDYCNQKNYENAYSLISDECKQILYPNLEDFRKNYCDKLFTEEKKVTMTLWVNTTDYLTYKVNFANDILATGGDSLTGSFEDYYTIVKDEENNLKLNINKYVYKEELQTSGTSNNLKITIVEVQHYIDYQQYKFTVENENESAIKIYNYSNSSWNVKDENEIIYEAYINEITNTDITIPGKAKATITLKFSKMYSTARTITSINFENMENSNNEIFTISIPL